MTTDLLHSAIRAYEQGDKTRAFQNLKELILQDPNQAAAWYWMAQVVEDPSRRQDCLNRCYKLDPNFQPLPAEPEPAPPSDERSDREAVSEDRTSQTRADRKVPQMLSRLNVQEERRFAVFVLLGLIVVLCLCLLIGSILWLGYRLGDENKPGASENDQEPTLSLTVTVESFDPEITPEDVEVGPSELDLSAELSGDAEGFYLVENGKPFLMDRIGEGELYTKKIFRADDFPSTQASVPVVLLRSGTFLPAWIAELIRVKAGIGIDLEMRNGLLTITRVHCDALFNKKGACQQDVHAGDILTAVDGEPTDNDRERAIELLRGAVGERVVLTLSRGTNTLRRELVRNVFSPGETVEFGSEIVQGSEATFVRFIPKRALSPGLYCFRLNNNDRIENDEITNAACFIVAEGFTEAPIAVENLAADLPEGLSSGLWSVELEDQSEEAPYYFIIDRQNRFFFVCYDGILEKQSESRLKMQIGKFACDIPISSMLMTIENVIVKDKEIEVVIELPPEESSGSAGHGFPARAKLIKVQPDTSTGDLAVDILGTWEEIYDSDLPREWTFGPDMNFEAFFRDDERLTGSYAWQGDALVVSVARPDDPSYQGRVSLSIITVGNAMVLYYDEGLGIYYRK